MDKEKRLNVLLESFEILSNQNIENNLEDIAKIIGQISKYNIDIAFDIWHKLIIKNKDLLKDYTSAQNLTSAIIDAFQYDGNLKNKIILDKIFKDPELTVLIFSDNICSDTMNIPIECLKYKKYEQAIKSFELIINSSQKDNGWVGGNNKYRGDNLSKDMMIGHIFECSSTHNYFDTTSIEIMYSWINTVEDREIKASLNSLMISIEEYHDEYERNDENDE